MILALSKARVLSVGRGPAQSVLSRSVGWRCGPRDHSIWGTPALATMSWYFLISSEMNLLA
jgi:hypothetical protein